TKVTSVKAFVYSGFMISLAVFCFHVLSSKKLSGDWVSVLCMFLFFYFVLQSFNPRSGYNLEGFVITFTKYSCLLLVPIAARAKAIDQEVVVRFGRAIIVLGLV